MESFEHRYIDYTLKEGNGVSVTRVFITYIQTWLSQQMSACELCHATLIALDNVKQ